jgi:hypothetical protein
MTDAEKLKGIFDLFNIEVSEAPGSFKANGFRFFPTENGEIDKITYYGDGMRRITATPEGTYAKGHEVSATPPLFEEAVK